MTITATLPPAAADRGHRQSFAQLRGLLAPQRRLLLAIAASVLVGAALEVLPPLIALQAVDAHLVVGQAAVLRRLGLIYLLVVAAQQGLSVVSAYCTAAAAGASPRCWRWTRPVGTGIHAEFGEQPWQETSMCNPTPPTRCWTPPLCWPSCDVMRRTS